jgi:protein-disulfide isomerase
MKQKNMFMAAVVLLIAAFVAAAFFYKNQKADQAAQLAAQNQVALVRADAPSFGNPDAPVHIVEFFDPACGTCRDFYPLVKALMDAHPGKIRLSMRYAPFHPGSDTVVKALEAARKQGQFKQALEALFVAQNSWVLNHTAQPDRIWPILESLGLDMGRLKNDMNLPEVATMITRDLADAKTMNVTMTPEYFVNGKPLPSFGFDQLKNLVDEALANTTAK